MTLTTDINQERRLTARVEKQWRICSRASFPRRCDIDRVKFGNDWQYCFMVDLSDSILESRFSYVGTGLKEEFGQLILDRQRIGEIAAGSLLELAAKAIQNVNEKKLPVATSGK